MAMQPAIWIGTASFQRSRSMGIRRARRKMSGVMIAHGSQSRMVRGAMKLHGSEVTRTTCHAKTNASSPQTRKLSSQPRRSG